MSSNFLGLPAENSSLRMTVFPVSFKIAITHPYRYSEFISESSPFEKRLQPNFPAKKKTSIITLNQSQNPNRYTHFYLLTFAAWKTKETYAP